MSIFRILKIFLFSFLFIFGMNAEEKKVPAANSFFREMGTVKTLSCTFIQEQFIAGLKNPIRLTGRYYMTNHGDLAWIVEQPIRFYCVIHQGKLTSWDSESGDKKSIDLKDHPAFSTMISMMKNFFAGKILVEKDYRCQVRSKREITLQPLKHNPLSDNVTKVEITLSADRRNITEVRIFIRNGDRNIMRFQNAVLDKDIPESVWKNGVPK